MVKVEMGVCVGRGGIDKAGEMGKAESEGGDV